MIKTITRRHPEHAIVHVDVKNQMPGNQSSRICVLYPMSGEVEGEGFIMEPISERVANRKITRRRILKRLESLDLKPCEFVYLNHNRQLSFSLTPLGQSRVAH